VSTPPMVTIERRQSLRCMSSPPSSCEHAWAADNEEGRAEIAALQTRLVWHATRVW